MANSIEDIAEKTSTKSKSFLPAPVLSNLEDETFSKMETKILAAIGDPEEEHLLLLRIQQDIIQT